MRLSDLQDKHKGSLAFVLGSGPSLRHIDEKLLEPFVTFAVNSSIIKAPNCDYFVSDDKGVQSWSYYRKEAQSSSCIKLFFQDKLLNARHHFPQDKLVFFRHKAWDDPAANTRHEDGLVMTKSATDPIIGARTSAGTAVHLAYIFGCDPIVLLGCDCCYDGRKRYFWQFPGHSAPVRTGAKVFSSPNHGKVNDKPVDKHCLDFIEYWSELSRVNKGKVNIIDASEDGLLSCFPKMNFKEVLAAYGDQTKSQKRY